MELIARNVHEALPKGIRAIKEWGNPRDSRNGPVLVMPEPVTTIFRKPMERVMFHRERDANPFFHFFESLWMLAGRNDVAFPALFVSRMKDFSDDGKTFNGAYGFRWREHFGTDQIQIICERLAMNPEDRRCVLAMWDGSHDLGLDSKDLPCNTQAFFSIGCDGNLDMTVCNRSNDMVWGLYGANAVHFSVLQEYMAAKIGVDVGQYFHLSNNYHAYLSTFTPLADAALNEISPYVDFLVRPYPLMQGCLPIDWDTDLEDFFQEEPQVQSGNFRTPLFNDVVIPLWEAHRSYRELTGEKRYTESLGILESCAASDWRWAACDWVEQRYRKWKKTADTGAQHG